MKRIKKCQTHDTDVERVLKKDGVLKVVLGKFENLSKINLKMIKAKMPKCSWAVRIIYNEQFGGVLIRQYPGEGNRLHYHPDADECWVILEGEWEWYIRGVGVKRARKDDIVIVRKGTDHRMTCVGKSPGIRLAITRPDVDHVYSEGK